MIKQHNGVFVVSYNQLPTKQKKERKKSELCTWILWPATNMTYGFWQTSGWELWIFCVSRALFNSLKPETTMPRFSV